MAKTIMMVNDPASMQQPVCLVPRGGWYGSIEACDGSDALSRLNGRKTHLVISGANIPNRADITFAENLKQMPSYKCTLPCRKQNLCSGNVDEYFVGEMKNG
ncbi:MAG: hypothetical protein A2Z95_10240 [Gallionellales bacterium GWA2_60_18]|nr:MAG: hypothetical protein A2Z95_10240 [Gallionellales bacterium GWA2_60_18]